MITLKNIYAIHLYTLCVTILEFQRSFVVAVTISNALDIAIQVLNNYENGCNRK